MFEVLEASSVTEPYLTRFVRKDISLNTLSTRMTELRRNRHEWAQIADQRIQWRDSKGSMSLDLSLSRVHGESG